VPGDIRDKRSDESERAIFRDAVRDAVPLDVPARAKKSGSNPAPVPVQSLLDAHETLFEAAAGPLTAEHWMDSGDELAFLRPGLSADVLKKLRRAHWITQDEVDLHGLNREQARLLLTQFLSECVKRGLRCVRVIHGKGLRSPNREPVLKEKIRKWLPLREDVLAFCQAPPSQGGSGALLVLLRGSATPRLR
jgi:DNA-nicking Smr family endonuclease